MSDSAAATTALLTEDHLSRTSEKRHPTRSPRDAASLILMDRSGKVPRALLGKRGKAHAFMPDLYVFPGGRRDPGDNRVQLARPLRDEVFDKLLVRTQSRFGDPAARGLAVASSAGDDGGSAFVADARGARRIPVPGCLAVPLSRPGDHASGPGPQVRHPLLRLFL